MCKEERSFPSFTVVDNPVFLSYIFLLTHSIQGIVFFFPHFGCHSVQFCVFAGKFDLLLELRTPSFSF